LLARVKQVRPGCLGSSSPILAKPLAIGLRLGLIILHTGNVNKGLISDNTAVAELIPPCDWTRLESMLLDSARGRWSK
jgi:hypothetical protein